MTRGVGEFTGGKQGGELRKFSVEAVHFTFNTKGLGGGEEKDVILIWRADREWRRAVPAFFSVDSMRDFRYSKAFMGSFSRKGDATRSRSPEGPLAL